MKKLFGFVLFGLIMSCGGSETVETDNAEKENEDFERTDEISSDTLAESTGTEIVESFAPIEIFLDDMPTKWWQLTNFKDIEGMEHHEGHAIYHWCYAEVPQIWFEAGKGDEWQLTVLYGQDSEQWLVEDFTAVESERELYRVVDGSFRLVPIYDYQEEKQVEFWWNKDIAFAGFKGIFSEETYFVPDDRKSEYEDVEEECDGDDY